MYNISNWTTKRIEGLVIPLAALYDLDEQLIKQGWRPAPPVVVAFVEGVLSVEIRCLAEAGVISGEWRDKDIVVEGIDICGEGSGNFYHDVLLPALRQSKGELEAILVWAGGDSISRLVVKDGVVTEPKVEL